MFPSLRPTLYGPMPSLGGYKLTSRNNDDCRVDHTDRVLADHGLERVAADLSQHPLFGALSLCLFKNQSYEGLLMRKTRETLHEVCSLGRLTVRLHAFKNNRALIGSFNSAPYSEAYHKFVFDLVSIAFDAQVVVCCVLQHAALLSETIYANKAKRQIRLLDLGDGHYEALFRKGSFEKDKIDDGTIEANLIKNYKEKGEFSFAPGAVPVINFSDDDEMEEITKHNGRDLFDQDDEFDEIERLNRLHKRSNSDTNYEALFSRPHDGYNKDHDHDDSSNSDKHVDKDSQADNDFKIFMYLEDKNEILDEGQDSPPDYAAKEKPVQVEKRLDNLFKREVPLANIYYDKEGEPSTSSVKVATADQTSYFPTDMGKRR